MKRIGILLAPALLGAAVLLLPIPHAQAKGAPRIVPIVAKRFAFSPAEITLKNGEPVVLRLTTQDVAHGLYMKALHIDAEVEPGETTDISITPDTPGHYTTICDRFCGAGHGNMKMTIIVE